ncbi:general transcription factor 3C polypeptide 5 [Plasmodium gonderi]|uniref:General transcription factor 3C polypeptide 5 n=1 Tax=Plasmodium gonderi TaxID=77519 RepID=A0A1Y1JMN8_PLAGO|nr:general transcription factor 3C polypeptide 5 [Plasmodium gonderi]GAW82838.1 general transcription factor 3C polypeptide 5 [Plasmodium gonderi]
MCNVTYTSSSCVRVQTAHINLELSTDMSREKVETINDDLYTKEARESERNESVYFEKVRKNEYICVEIPGRVKKGSSGLSAVESLGGVKKMTELFNFHYNGYRTNENLILTVNSNDMFSSFISANSAKVYNVLIKIKKTRKNVYKFEFLGFVRYLYYFDNMIDFYYIPTFYNRHDYDINYMQYLTRGSQEKKRKKKKKKKKKEQKGEERVRKKGNTCDIVENINQNGSKDLIILKINENIHNQASYVQNKGALTDITINQFHPHQNGDKENMSHMNDFLSRKSCSMNNMTDMCMHNSNTQYVNLMNPNMNPYEQSIFNRNYYPQNIATYEHRYSTNMNNIINRDHNKDTNSFLKKYWSNTNNLNFYALNSNTGIAYVGGKSRDNIYAIAPEERIENRQKVSTTDMQIYEMNPNRRNYNGSAFPNGSRNGSPCGSQSLSPHKSRRVSRDSSHNVKGKEARRNRRTVSESVRKIIGENVKMNNACIGRANIRGKSSVAHISTEPYFANMESFLFQNCRDNYMVQTDNQEDDYYFTDTDENEIYKKIIDSNKYTTLFDKVKECEYSSDESEGYELNCCIHSKCTNPYFYRNYESKTTSKYLREYKYLISKYTSPLYSQVEASAGEMEEFIQELIMSKTEKGQSASATQKSTAKFSQSRHDMYEEEMLNTQELHKNMDSHSHNEDVKDAYKNILDRETFSAAGGRSVGEHPHKHNVQALRDSKIFSPAYNDEEELLIRPSALSSNLQGEKETDESRSVSRIMNLSDKPSNQIIVIKKTVHCNPIAKFDDPTLPCVPFDSALKKYVSDKLYKKVKELFEVRPIWTKEVILEHLENVSTYCLKSCFSRICFYFADGPWRRTYCKYGYDPRKDPSSYIYQTIDFRDNYFKEIKTKSANEISRIIVKKKNFIDNVVTKIIKNLHNIRKKKTHTKGKKINASQREINIVDKKQEIKMEKNDKRDFNVYSEWSQNVFENYDNYDDTQKWDKSVHNTSTDSEYPKDINDLKNMFDIYSSVDSPVDEITPQMNEEINDIFQFLKKSITFHLRKSFSAETHFSITPLKLSTVYQYIDIYDNNVSDHLLNLKTQEICTKEYGWMECEDIAKIRDILSVRAVTLRRAHIK